MSFLCVDSKHTVLIGCTGTQPTFEARRNIAFGKSTRTAIYCGITCLSLRMLRLLRLVDLLNTEYCCASCSLLQWSLSIVRPAPLAINRDLAIPLRLSPGVFLGLLYATQYVIMVRLCNILLTHACSGVIIRIHCFDWLINTLQNDWLLLLTN